MTKSGVHLIAAGFEYDRVIKPMFKDFNVKKAYLLIHDSKNDRGDYRKQEETVNRYIKKLHKAPIDWEDVKIDIYNFDGTFKVLYNLINREVKNNPVYINISSAPKILQAALTLAAFLNTKYGEIKLFYVQPERYYEGELISTVLELNKDNTNEKATIKRLKELASIIQDHGMAEGETKIHEIPPFTLADITQIEEEMLQVIREKELSNSLKNVDYKITDSMADNNIAFDYNWVSSIKELKELLDNKLGEEIPRSNVKYYLNNLEKLGMVETEMKKKELQIRLTRAGELYADTIVNDS